MIRTFIALPLPEEIKEILLHTARSLRAAGIDARWVKAEALHLTLKFLGDIDEVLLKPITQGLDDIFADFPVLHLRLSGLGAFPGTRRARVIWTGLAGDTDALIRLASKVEGLCAGFGLPAETRPFQAHITLGRLKIPAMVDLSTHIPEHGFTVESGHFYHSELRREGALHTVLHTSRMHQ